MRVLVPLSLVPSGMRIIIFADSTSRATYGARKCQLGSVQSDQSSDNRLSIVAAPRRRQSRPRLPLRKARYTDLRELCCHGSP